MKKQSRKKKLIITALTGVMAWSFGYGANLAAEASGDKEVIRLTDDVMSSNVDPNFIKVPGANSEVKYEGTIVMEGKKTEVDKFVRKMKEDGSYAGGYNEEERERHLLIASFAPEAKTELLGDDKSTYNVDAVVSIEGGDVKITGKDLTTNLVYMTSPLSTSKYAKKDAKQNGKMDIELSGDLIAHNDDWDLYPRMDGFHYGHSSNLYSRGGISVNGNNELNIKAKKVQARYLRNSDWHHGEGKAKISIKADSFDLNRMGRSAYTPDEKSDEQWVLGKTENDKGGMFQFYNAAVNIDAKDVKIGGVRPGQAPREDDLTADRIDIDAGNRASIDIKAGNFFQDGEMRAIDGSQINVKADEKLVGRNAFAGYTENYRYGKYKDNGGYREGLCYYRSSGDEENEDMSVINLEAPDIDMHVSHQAEEGGYNHVGFGHIGAGHQGTVNIKADRNLNIYNAWNGFEGKGPNALTMMVTAGGRVNLEAENVLLEGAVMLGNTTARYDAPVIDPKTKKRVDWEYREKGIYDDTAGTLNIKGYGKDKGSMIFGGEICGLNSDLNVEDFKSVKAAVFTGMWNGNTVGSKINFKNIENVYFDATNQWHLDNHTDPATGEPQPSHENHGKGYVIINSRAGNKAHNLLNVEADKFTAHGIIAGSNNFQVNFTGQEADLYRLKLDEKAKAELKGDKIVFRTDALAEGKGTEIKIDAKDLTIAGEDYYVNDSRPELSDNLLAKGSQGALVAAGNAKAEISIAQGGRLKGRIFDNVVRDQYRKSVAAEAYADAEKYNDNQYDSDSYGHAEVKLAKDAKWSYEGDSVIEKLTGEQGAVDLTGNNAPTDTLQVNTLKGAVDFKIDLGAASQDDEIILRKRRNAEKSWADVDKVIIDHLDSEAEKAQLGVAVKLKNLKEADSLKGKKVLSVTNDQADNAVVSGKPMAEKDAVLAYVPELSKVEENDGFAVVVDDVKVIGATTNAQAPKDALTGGYLTLLSKGYSSNQRLARLRNGEEGTGIWADYHHHKYDYKDVNAKFNHYAVGFDNAYKLSDSGNAYFGMAAEINKGTSDFALGDSKIRDNSLTVYGGLTAASGLYVSGWINGGKIHNDYKTIDGDKANLKGNAWSLGTEIGKKFEGDNGKYWMPQLGFSYGTWLAEDTETKQDLSFNPQRVNSKLLRLGAVFGKAAEGNNVYAGLHALHEFGNDLKYTMKDKNDNSFEEVRDIKGTWFEASLGGNYKFNDKVLAAGEVFKSFGGDMNKNWGISLNINYLF